MDKNTYSNLSDSSKIQEIFLNHCRKNKIEVMLEGNGREVRGYIVGFDSESIILHQNDSQMLFYKAGLRSVRPCQDVNFIFNDGWRLPKFSSAYDANRVHAYRN